LTRICTGSIGRKGSSALADRDDLLDRTLADEEVLGIVRSADDDRHAPPLEIE
jgi:hypothetical protein